MLSAIKELTKRLSTSLKPTIEWAMKGEMKMQTRRTAAIVAALVTLALLLVVGSVGAKPPNPVEGEVAIAGTVASKISYQGQLTDAGGNPLNGNYDMKFELYDAPSGGTKWWEQTKSGVPVENGLFNVELDVDQALFNGQELWLAVKVDWETLSPRQEILPVPYALSLKPGAAISASIYDGPVLRVENTDANPAGGGYALVGKNASNYTWRPAIYGENTGASAGVYGRSDGWHATVGWQAGSDPSHAGVYGHNGGAGPGVYGKSPNGYAGVYGESTSGYGVVGDSESSVGVFGGSNSGYAGLFASMSGAGVYASSNAGPGLKAYSRDGTGLHAESACCDIIEGFSALDREFRVTNDGDVYADGTFNPGGADLAEMLPAMEGLQPGDVLIIGPDGKLARSIAPYASNVVGVYSTNPGFVGGSDEDGTNPGKVPLAVIGVVPVKASAENGPIAPGDLLATSSTPGYAMRADHFVGGAILGKALEGLDESTGVILILVMLQ